jgi:HK97 family phage prohead protease
VLTDLRNLPAPVVERIDANLSERRGAYRRGLDVVQRGRLLESRASKIEARMDDGGPVVDGYATVYGWPYDVAGGPDAYGWVEVIEEGACAKSVREQHDVRLLFDHEGIPLARTKSGTLELESDEIGLRCSTPGGLDMRSPLVQTIASAVDRQDLEEMSFAFEVLRQEWSPDYMERRILEVRLHDVSIVTYPANPATVVGIRGDDRQAETSAGMSLAYARALATRH